MGVSLAAELKAQNTRGKERKEGGKGKESKPIISSKDKHPIFFPHPK